jgi:hypothetical protein
MMDRPWPCPTIRTPAGTLHQPLSLVAVQLPAVSLTPDGRMITDPAGAMDRALSSSSLWGLRITVQK